MAGGEYTVPIDPTRTQIGWIGIGVMGAAMASRLLAAGYSLSIYARTPSKAAALLSHGAHLAASPAELAASSDVIFTMIGHPSDVRNLVLDTLVPSLKPNTVIIDHTSSHPALAREIHSAAQRRHCHSVDAPVSGGDIGAREGKLAIFAGGEAEIVEWLKPLFDLLGKVTYMGSAGKGQSCKIANQVVVGGNLVGLSEGLVFAEKAGLDKKKFLGAVRGGAAGSMALELFGERMIDKDFRPGGFADYMVKDLGMAVDLGEEEGAGDEAVVLPGAGLCKQLFSAMVANGNGKLGTQGLITVIQMINSIKD
ncbi:putative 3-hydroxyisobutyrate dehydrogenase-like 2, mitochondrial-like [Dorcoceras hygrometricum]|uniref:Putative 3-hydroxyisobutyrate dehydrogenase-like 2, mitochondrial-like n=1 Tax=Dorcoceras hygrometricum TaxID=472368 RepID=A0A2Z7B8C1_9LAMI|nr:putative 3-hydroxyisobutyrate dehydrogenase-like 2, mitochondrial-like [Dorcoceras hygrometricum]